MIERTSAIVLRRTNYGEADRILQLLTPEGKISALARGVRRQNSKLAGSIELFSISDMVIRRGKSDLGIITSARAVHFYRHILEDYDRLEFGYEAIKQVSKSSEMVNEPDWYDILKEVFMGLDARSLPLGLVQTWFYLHFSRLTGHELNLERDVDGDRLKPDLTYSYDMVEKGFEENSKGDVTADHIKLLRMINSKPLHVVAQIGGIEDVLPVCLWVARGQASLN